MPTRLYLDTARLGQMSPSAQLAHIDFVRLAAEEAGSLHFDDFLRHGSAALPTELQARYPGLATWQGIADLKCDLKQLAGARQDSRVLLANRSTQLMRFAARLFLGICRNVLMTDLTWPNYADILRRQAKQGGNRLTFLPVRGAIHQERLTAANVVDRIATAFVAHRCDGLFLPAVDNHGIRVPVEHIVREVRRQAELRFVVVDGAQAFCHVPTKLSDDACDLYIAGCHKWLRACHPMGLAFYGSRRSQAHIDATLARLLAAGETDDPLLAFSQELEGGRPSQFGETINLASLFSCRGAVDDALTGANESVAHFSTRLANAATLVAVARHSGWLARYPAAGLRSGIVLLQTPHDEIRSLEPDVLGWRLLTFGIAATAYKRGMLRFSMPDRPWQAEELTLLASALSNISTTFRKCPRDNQWSNNAPVTHDCHS